MSYLSLPSLAMGDILKGTISLWFRFSDDTVTNAAPYQSERIHPNAPGVLDSTMPLVTFGREVMAQVYDSTGRTWTQATPGGTLSHSAPQVVDVGEAPCGPSHIGVVCGSVSNLVMQFQMDTRADVQGLVAQTKNVHWQLDVGDEYQMYTEVEDVSYIRVGQPETFRVNPDFDVAVDEWHHLLVSFDFTDAVDVVATEDDPETDEALRAATIQSYCKLWYAFDDEDKKGKDNIGWVPALDQPPLGWVPQDDNGIIPQNAEHAVTTFTIAPPDEFVSGGGQNPEYHWASVGLPTSDGPMGLPASEEFVDTVYHCEMAEFQFFAGVVLYTGSEAERRYFVDADGKPVPPKETEELLGLRPHVLLHKSKNWKRGKNTGSLGATYEEEGDEIVETIIPSGQFEPTALIRPYKPEPKLGEPEEPEEPEARRAGPVRLTKRRP